MDVQVERNLERAQRGGVPGTRGLVEAFLKIGADDPFAEDGTVDGLPVWEVKCIFLFLHLFVQM
ncbi:hypothetical protein ANCDUO_10027 [Ancylostoma duodenale]|uniref:Uncharacterized protein n=1 Tax=Ancylostoma duodenale TaxID=51022 RepID=A0A0C2GL95_9BILA|nr:hypothetical protein ANCDUO_10027 [Ancylostoma duodenale]